MAAMDRIGVAQKPRKMRGFGPPQGRPAWLRDPLAAMGRTGVAKNLEKCEVWGRPRPRWLRDPLAAMGRTGLLATPVRPPGEGMFGERVPRMNFYISNASKTVKVLHFYFYF